MNQTTHDDWIHFSTIVVAGSVSRRAIPYAAIFGIAAPASGRPTNTRCVLFGRPGRLLHIIDLPTTKYDNGDTDAFDLEFNLHTSS